ncbi:response regulator transcription factor [Amycolatopsis sp. NPDC059090]|uniref:response regulator transcription factor n=1 Tax=unclassified Amycolatopsis TaxID=2618356 RepID=UPI00366FF3DC
MNRRPSLSGRETQMLAHVARGLSNYQIAQVEYVSAETVKTHLYNAFRKLRAVNRAHAVAIAYHVGIFATGTSFGPAIEPSPLTPVRRSPPHPIRSDR